MRGLAANALTILIVLGLVALAVFGVADSEIDAAGPLAEEKVVQIPRGANLREISTILDDAGALPERGLAGAIDGASLFRIAAAYSGQSKRLKFGEYALPKEASIDQLLDLLEQGGNVQHRVTLPEGMTVAMAVERLMAEEKLTGEITEVPPEGSLLPDSYDFQRGDTRQSVIARMQTAMETELQKAWDSRAENLPLASKAEMLILASIVEKETRPAEHGKVASVFINRLNRGMKLQTDPTVIYGITLGQAPLGRGLRKSELRARTPYNTYVIDGLPPTPIANPGRESIRAVANPETTEYLFFVADGTGGHAFAETLAEHNKNVAAWRAIERERNANQ